MTEAEGKNKEKAANEDKFTQADRIVEEALNLKGNRAYDNYCQRFVREVYERAGLKGSAASASEACQKWLISTDKEKIPKGAAVYFKGTNQYGHVGIYTGNGNIVHAAGGVRVQSLEYCDSKYVFIGWGWHGGVAPQGARVAKTSTKAGSKATKSTDKSSGKRALTIENINTVSLKTSEGVIKSSLDSVGATGAEYELLIENDRIYLPALVGEITLTSQKALAPARLEFKVLKDNAIDFREGSPVRLRIKGVDLFKGFVFEKQRFERDIITVTAYDSLRYFKNRDSLIYRNKKYSDLLKMLIADYNMNEGDICDTGYVIEKQLAEGTVFDILADAADMTKAKTGREFVLLDSCGKICLRSVEAMTTKIVYDKTNIGSIDYTTTIDKEVYDHVILAVDDKKQGMRNLYTLSDSNTALWGRLSLYLKPKEELTVAALKNMGESLLKKYSRKRRYLALKDARGYKEIRAGSIVGVNLDLGDIIINEPMCCERVVHKFYRGHHLSDIDLYGREGEFDV